MFCLEYISFEDFQNIDDVNKYCPSKGRIFGSNHLSFVGRHGIGLYY